VSFQVMSLACDLTTLPRVEGLTALEQMAVLETASFQFGKLVLLPLKLHLHVQGKLTAEG
jgi:hypothetical protein